jgi:hypothetical protein
LKKYFLILFFIYIQKNEMSCYSPYGYGAWGACGNLGAWGACGLNNCGLNGLWGLNGCGYGYPWGNSCGLGLGYGNCGLWGNSCGLGLGYGNCGLWGNSCGLGLGYGLNNCGLGLGYGNLWGNGYWGCGMTYVPAALNIERRCKADC